MTYISDEKDAVMGGISTRRSTILTRGIIDMRFTKLHGRSTWYVWDLANCITKHKDREHWWRSVIWNCEHSCRHERCRMDIFDKRCLTKMRMWAINDTTTTREFELMLGHYWRIHCDKIQLKCHNMTGNHAIVLAWFFFWGQKIPMLRQGNFLCNV